MYVSNEREKAICRKVSQGDCRFAIFCILLKTFSFTESFFFFHFRVDLDMLFCYSPQ